MYQLLNMNYITTFNSQIVPLTYIWLIFHNKQV